MLKYLAGGRKRIDRLHIIVDTVPNQQQQTALKQTLKNRAQEVLDQIPFTIDHHGSAAHALLQAADYCAWATYKKWQSGDTRSYDRLRPKIRNEFDLYARGETDYY